MKRLFQFADEYVQESGWKDLALVKFCLCAIGVLIGLCAPKKHARPIAAAAGLVFLITYIPLMAKFLKIVFRRREP